MLVIVLRRQNYREDDQIITFFSIEKGKVTAIAKGIKKIISKNSGYLQIGALAEVELASGKEADYVASVRPVEIFAGIHGDYQKLFLTGHALALVNAATPERQSDEKLFTFLTDFLRYINEAATMDSMGVMSAFILKLWRCIGFGLELKQCISCSQELAGFGTRVIDLVRGGMVCEVCRSTQRIQKAHSISSAEHVYLTRLFHDVWHENSVGSPEHKNKVRLYNMVHQFAQFHAGQKLANFVKSATMVAVI